MSGLEQAPSILHQMGEVATMLGQYIKGWIWGVIIGVILFHAARRLKADASWILVPPVVSFVILTSIHASRVVLTAGVIAALISVVLVGWKGPFGDFGIRDALQYWWVRIGVSVLLAFLLLDITSVKVLIESILILVFLVRAWWEHGLSSFVQGFFQRDGE